MVGVLQAAGVYKMGVFAAQARCLFIHILHEGVHAAGNSFGQDVAGFVGRLDHYAVEQLFHGELFAHFDAGGAGIRREHVNGALGSGDGLIQCQLPFVDGLQHQKRRHTFGDAGRVQLFVGILIQQHLSGVAVHQQGGFGGNGQGFKGILLRRGQGGRTQQADEHGGGQKN